MSQPASQTSTADAPRRLRWLEAAILALAVLATGALLFVYGPFRQPRTAVAVDGRAITITVAPLDAPEVLPGELDPVARYLGRALERPVRLRRGESVAQTAQALLAGETEIALLPPLTCVQVREESRSAARWLVVQAVRGAFDESSLLVVRRGHDLPGPGQLAGRSLCTAPSPSAEGDLLPRLWLRSQGVDPEPLFANRRELPDQLGALRELARGRCDVAAVGELALATFRDRQGDSPDLEVLARTGHVPGPCWLASPQLDEQLARGVEQVLASIDPREVVGQDRIGARLGLTGFHNSDGSTYRGLQVAAQLAGMLRLPPGVAPPR